MTFRKLIALSLCFSLLLATTAHAASGKPVTLILKDGKTVEGELVGLEAGAITLKVNGKIREYEADKVKKAFDADGQRINLEEGKTAEPAAKTAEEPAPAKPAKSAQPSGASKAGNILMASGLAGMLVGGLIGIWGVSEMSSATSTYYTGPNNNAGAYYTIPGEKGYYTSAQYYQYYAGQSWAYVGGGVFVVGGILCITGAVVGSSGRNRSALLNVDESGLALGVPQPTLLPDGYRAELLHASF